EAPEPWMKTYTFRYVVEVTDPMVWGVFRRFGGQEALQRIILPGLVHDSFPFMEVDVVEEPSDKNTVRTFKTTVRPGQRTLTWQDWPREPRALFGLVPLFLVHVPLRDQVYGVMDYLVGYFGAGLAMLVSVIVTAAFIPNMLQKGTVDLLLVK